MSRRERAFTLIELVVVTAILVVVAGIALAHLRGVSEHARRTAAEATLRTVRNAILGTEGAPGYLTDVGALPSAIEDLFVRPDATPAYDPISKRGWNGPYLQSTGFTEKDPGVQPYPGGGEKPAVVDPWLTPVRLQIPDPEGEFARLVSAGPDRVFQTPETALGFDPSQEGIEALIGDDLVLFLTYSPGQGD